MFLSIPICQEAQIPKKDQHVVPHADGWAVKGSGNQIASLFNRLDAWRHLPAYQLERRADIFFGLFLPDALNHHLRSRGISINPRVIPEFPLG